MRGVDVQVAGPVDPRLPLSRREILDLLECLAQSLQISLQGLAVRIVDDREMAEIHARFAAGIGPTNVLSFPAASTHRLGDLVLSSETVAREAELYLQPYRAYTARLLAHGLLHLAGVPHGPEMDQRTEAAVAACGQELPGFALGDPWRDACGDG